MMERRTDGETDGRRDGEADRRTGGQAEEGTAPLRRDDANWAKPVAVLDVDEAAVPGSAINLNVEGRRVSGPIHGFGRMWRKRHSVRLTGVTVTPVEVVKTWKEHFGEFWPRGNRFYGSLKGLAPGEVAVLNMDMPGPATLSTGVLVLYADDESFALMTPQGHMLAGLITFSAYEEDGVTVAQAEILMRASDPFFEIGMVLFGHRAENRFWEQTLGNLATYFGVRAKAETTVDGVDTRYQWRRVTNVWHNAAIRTGIYVAITPLRRVGRLLRRRTAAGPSVSRGA
ncbi:MAG: hypothetical protein QOJ59_338 [Thermomicrobiales bacterium]|nr:hypothetical protein [Thermomicrobiales bacterium]